MFTLNVTNSSHAADHDHGLSILLREELLYVLGAVIIVINVLVFVTLMTRTVFHDPVKQLYLLHLAAADLLVGCVMLMRAALNTWSRSLFADTFVTLCFCRLLLTLLSLSSSILLLTALTAYVYIMVSRPLSAVARLVGKPAFQKSVIAGVWVSCSVNACVSYFYSDYSHLHCKLDCIIRYVYPYAAFVTFNVVIVIVPAVCTVVCQAHLLLVVRRNLWNTYTHSLPLDTRAEWDEVRHVEREHVKKQYRSAVTITIIGSSFIVCALPFCITQLFMPTGRVSNTLIDSIGFIWYLNSLINPIIYSWRLPAFRQNMKLLFCCLVFSKQRLSSVTLH